MFKQLCIGLFLFSSFTLWAQEGTQIIITAFKTGGGTVRLNDKSYVKSASQKDEIKYTLDKKRGCLTTKRYKKYRSKGLYDRDTAKWETKRTSYFNWKNEISSESLIKFLSALKTNIDTLDVDDGFVVRSSGSFTLSIKIIQEGNTFKFLKQIPCSYTSPWFKSIRNGDYILNPAIDAQLLTLLPKNFLGREKFITFPPIESRCNDSCVVSFFGKPLTLTLNNVLLYDQISTDSLDALMMTSFERDYSTKEEAAGYAIKIKAQKKSKEDLWLFRIHSTKAQTLAIMLHTISGPFMQKEINVKEGFSYWALDVSDFYNYSVEYEIRNSKGREIKGKFQIE